MSCWVPSWSGRRRNKKRGLIGRLTPCRLCAGDVSVSVQRRPTPPLVPSPSLAHTRTWRGCGLGLPVHSGWRLWFVGHERHPGEERPLGLSCFVVVTVAAAGQVAVAEDRLDRRPDVPVSSTGQPVGLVAPGICADCVFMPSFVLPVRLAQLAAALVIGECRFWGVWHPCPKRAVSARRRQRFR